jgi:hypothetical protein
MLLSAMVSELQTEVPAVDGVPSTAQYEQACIDAVREFSRRCGVQKLGELTIVANTASYTLPTDFQKLIWLDPLVPVDGVVVTDRLIPLGSNYTEEYVIQGMQITFKPVPAYSMTRDYKYKAGWVMTGTAGTRTFVNLNDAEWDVVKIKARQLAQEKIMNASAADGGAVKYSLGAVSVDKSSSIADMSKNLFVLNGQFVSACEQYNGAYGVAA